MLHPRSAARLVFLLLLCTALRTAAQPVVCFNPLITGLSAPIDIAQPAGETVRLFIAEQDGLVRIWNGTALLPAPFINMTSITNATGEQGLLSIAFSPDYATNGHVFVYYTLASTGAVALSRYTVSASDPNVVDPASRVDLFSVAKPAGRTNHNGGDLNFGPDGFLYLALGDGGGANDPDNLAQTPGTVWGKMLRIDVSGAAAAAAPYYTVPSTNPFVSDATYDPRIFSLGLRNPFRWSFDRQTGDTWISDVGQGAREEVNFRAAGTAGGVNYGWRCFEGSISTPSVPDCTPPNLVQPVWEYDNPGAQAITGGFVYRGTDYPALQGYHLSVDVYTSNLYLTRSNGSGTFSTVTQSGAPGFIVAFGEGSDGELYAASLSTNTVYALSVTGVLPVRVGGLSLSEEGGRHLVRWTASGEEPGTRYDIEWSNDGRAFRSLGTQEGNGSGAYRYTVTPQPGERHYYRLAVRSGASVQHTPMVQLRTGGRGLALYPTVVQGGSLTLYLPVEGGTFQLFNSEGARIWVRDLRGLAGSVPLSLPPLPAGTYVAQVRNGQEFLRQKFVIR